MAQLAFEKGHADTTLEHLKGYLSVCVEDTCDTCEGCGQPRCQDAAMLTPLRPARSLPSSCAQTLWNPCQLLPGLHQTGS